MVLRNHIAYRFLTDDTLWFELLETQHPAELKAFYNKEISELPGEVHSLYSMVNNQDQKPYLVTESVVENLDMFKIERRENGHYDWTVFKHLPDQKITFILPQNQVLRMRIVQDRMHFCSLTFEFYEGSKNDGHLGWVLYYLNRETGALCEHFDHQDVKGIEEFVYKLLCFFYLVENNEVVIPAGKVHGTRKTGKVSNDFGFPLTMVTSRWNTTTIRLEKFGVRGHFRLQPFGEGRNRVKLVFIEPFEKNGYVRKAGKLTT